jgi:hypothetical protein
VTEPLRPSPAAVAARRPDPAGRLSGQVVGQLEPGEQFVLWALRQRLRDCGGNSGAAAPSAVLVHGFKLAFGLAYVEAGLAAFASVFEALRDHARPSGIDLCPLRCACVSADEQAVMALVAAAQAGEGPWLDALARRLVAPAFAPALGRGAAAFAAELRRAGLTLPPLAARTAGSGTLH